MKNKVAIVLTQYVDQGGSQWTQKVVVPVSRIVKGIDQVGRIRSTGLQATPIYRTSLELRTPEDHMSIVESHEEIARLMNGDDEPCPTAQQVVGLVAKRTLTHGNNADCPEVQAGVWDRCKGHEG